MSELICPLSQQRAEQLKRYLSLPDFDIDNEQQLTAADAVWREALVAYRFERLAEEVE